MDHDLQHNDDPILDACLAEVIGGHAPPDLTARIVSGQGQTGNGDAALADSYGEAVPDPPPVVTRPPVFARRKRASANRGEDWTAAMLVGIAAGFVGIVIAVGITARMKSSKPQIAEGPEVASEKVAPVVPGIRRERPGADRVANMPGSTETPVPNVPEPQSPIVSATPSPESNSSPQVSNPAVSAEKMTFARGESRREPSSDATIVSYINNQFTQSWKEVGLRPTVSISDAEWCQRVYSRVLGRAATAEESKALADDKSSNRREQLVRRLLTDKAYTDEFTQHWSAILVQAFLGRGSSAPGAMASREDLQKYFAAALAADKPYSQIVNDVLTATGSPRPGADDYNPAVNFLLDGMTIDATVATARVARVLLGHQLQCAQCHQHPSRGWTQDQFWGLNASLRQVRVERRDGTPKLVSVRSAGIPAVSYAAPDGQVKKVTPSFIDGTPLVSDASSGGDILRALAEQIVRSDDFCRATVNRIWAQIFDYGFTRPIDDLGPSLSPTEPEVLDRLAAEFAAHDYDLKDIIRWAVLSDPFGRSSKLTDLASKDMPEEGGPALFSRFYSRPTRSADAFASLVQATRIRSSGSTEREMEKARIDWLAQANRTSAKAPAKKAPVIESPAIVVKGNDLAQQPATGDPSGLVKRVAASEISFDQKAEHLILAALGRQPTAREKRAATELLRIAGGSHPVALEDLWWALQNSSESVFDR